MDNEETVDKSIVPAEDELNEIMRDSITFTREERDRLRWESLE